MIPIHLLNVAWQSLLLSACAWLMVALLLRDARRRAWMAALGIFVAVLAPFFMLAWPAPKAEPSFALSPEPAAEWKPNWTVKVQPIPARPTAMQRAIAQPVWNWSDLVLPAERVWMLGAVLLVLWMGARTMRAWWWRRRLRPGPRHSVCSFEGSGSPCVVGLLHPRIAVPREHSFSEDQWRWLLAHEGEHVRGGDAMMAWLFEWARAWLWWNPFVHALINAWSQAREEVCDAAAVRSKEEGEHYANFLIEIASAHQTSGALAMAASRPARRLKARLLAVLNGRRVCDRVGLGFAVLATCSIGGAMVIVSCSGVRVDDPVPPKAIHLFTIFVEPTDFVTRVKEMQRQGYVLEEPWSEERLGSVNVAILKNAKGERTEVRKDVTANQILTRVYKVAPDFLSKAGTGKTAKQTLEACGIAFPEGSSAFYNPATSQLTVKHTAATLQRLEKVINDLQASLPQVYLQTKIIDGPELIGESGHIYDQEGYEALYRSASQRKGFDLMSAPSLTSKVGQRATIEVVREVIGVPPRPVKFVGVRVEIDPHGVANGKLKLAGQLHVGRDTAPKKQNERAFVASEVSSYDNVKQWDTPFDVELGHGQTAVLHLGETLKGRFVSMFVTAKAIRPDGKEATQFDENCTAPVQGLQVSDPKPATEADEKSMQRDLKAAEQQRSNKQVYLTAKIVDLKASDTPNDVMKSIFNLGLPGSENVKDEVKPQDGVQEKPIILNAIPAELPPGVVALSGVLTDPQFQVVIRALSQKKGVNLLVLPSTAVQSGQTAKLTSGTQECVVEPMIGPDGYTIDLNIGYEDKANGVADPQRKVTTAVTIWDGQTVVLGDTVAMEGDEQSKHSRLIFVTGRIIDPTGQPKSKTKQ